MLAKRIGEVDVKIGRSCFLVGGGEVAREGRGRVGGGGSGCSNAMEVSVSMGTRSGTEVGAGPISVGARVMSKTDSVIFSFASEIGGCMDLAVSAERGGDDKL